MIFVDTSFWIGLQYAADDRATDAAALWANKRGPLITSNHVIGETWTFLRRRTGFDAAIRFVTLARGSSRVAVIHIDETTEEAAWAWLRRHDERVYSFVDATSFALMRRLRIREALAFDGDFTAGGFVELRP
ncbi:MAG: type II toxin-antitoxin system VapC family toxin [Candidatus Limnocylindrales bacterium]